MKATKNHSVSSQAPAAHARLQKSEVSAAEDGLCSLEGLDFSSPGLLAHLEVLQKPIAFGMQSLNVLKSCHQGLGGCCLFHGTGFHIGLELGLGFALVRQRLLIGRALLSGILHSSLVVLLSILFCGLGCSQLLVEILDH